MVLPDVLQSGLKVVFCGSAVGAVSARLGAYYAHPGNRFWQVLHEIGLTPRRLRPEEYPSLPTYGIGLTDVVKEVSGRDIDISLGDMTSSRGRLALQSKIERFKPQVLAFNGKKAAEAFLDTPRVSYGRQPALVGLSVVFVLPSTSGAARAFWDLSYWIALEDFVGRWSPAA